MAQFEDIKIKYRLIEQEYDEYRSNYAIGQFDKDKIEEILLNFREQNDSVAFGRQMNEVINKLQ